MVSLSSTARYNDFESSHDYISARCVFRTKFFSTGTITRIHMYTYIYFPYIFALPHLHVSLTYPFVFHHVTCTRIPIVHVNLAKSLARLKPRASRSHAEEARQIICPIQNHRSIERAQTAAPVLFPVESTPVSLREPRGGRRVTEPRPTRRVNTGVHANNVRARPTLDTHPDVRDRV